VTEEDVLAALGTVYDPELDEPITALRFVSACEISDAGDVDVRLRLPTPQCAPNFAYLMAADARAAVKAVPGVGEVTVTLADHYTGDEINAAVARDGGFGEAFPGETRGELGALRALFQRKALLARQAHLLDTVPEPATARLRDLAGPDAERCRDCATRWPSTRPTTRPRSCAATARPCRRKSSRASHAWRR
jgi:metal-sulfur cluster biosynthetic enzyme